MTKNRKDLTPRHVSKFAVGRTKIPSGANIRVVIRVRPLNLKESGENHRLVVQCNAENSLTFDPEQDDAPFFFHGVKQRRRDLLKKQNKNLQFIYDRVFPETATNEEVFCSTTRDLIEILMNGCNCSVFAYGATGAGKTYTMLGKPETPGITVLTIGELFLRKDQLSDERDFELFVTYLEVYNENVRDLLKYNEKPLQVREDAQIGVRVAGLTHRKITSADELFYLLDEGNRNRTQHPTDSNAESSRSHAVFQVYLKMTVKTTGQAIMAKLSMIDLAGSERGAATGCKGLRFTEGANINKSLLALGNCINSLADGQKHIPYRNSKLTRILKDSLGGNCHTVMIANISPSSLTFEDTYNTLKYATRAKKIKINVTKNVMTSGKSSAEYIKIIDELTEENRRLKEENAMLKEKPVASAESRMETDKEEITTTTSERDLNNVTFSCTATVESTVSEEAIESVKKLYANYKYLKDSQQSYIIKQKLHNARLQYQDEEKDWLSGLNSSSLQHKEHNTRLQETLNRIRRRSLLFDEEIKLLDDQISKVEEEIKTISCGNSDLTAIITTEEAKLGALIANNDKKLNEALVNLQAFVLVNRGEFMQQAVPLLQSWHSLLTKRGFITKDAQETYEKLNPRSALNSEDGTDSGMSSTSSSSNTALTVSPILEPSAKRSRTDIPTAEKDASDSLDSTYVYPSSATRPKNTESALFKEYQPSSSSKGPVKCHPSRSSPRIRKQKENKSSDILKKIRRVGNNVQVSRHAHKALTQSLQKPPFR